MPIFSTRELKRLLEIAEAPCLSIYLPTHRKGSQTQQDSIRLKNLLRQAESKLESIGWDFEQIKARLEPGWQLVENYDFWQHQSDGLALFFSAQHCLSYRLPLSFEETVMVSEQFYIKPLLPLLVHEGSYYILAASQNKVRFFEATRDRIEPLELESLTQSLVEALKYDDPESQLQFHSAGAPVYHGQGSGADENKTDILRFFQQVNQDLQPQLRDQQAPLVFVGVDYLFPIYQEANTYRYLQDESVATNPDQMIPDQIHQKTWPIVAPIFEQSLNDAIAAYANRMETHQTASDLLDILIAAHDGQVESLFIPVEQSVWGRFDAKNRTFDTEPAPTPQNEDLFNLAAVYTLFCGGQVYAVSADEIPGDANIAATLRYPIPEVVSNS